MIQTHHAFCVHLVFFNKFRIKGTVHSIFGMCWNRIFPITDVLQKSLLKLCDSIIILLYTCKAIHSCSPPYFSDLVQISIPSRCLGFSSSSFCSFLSSYYHGGQGFSRSAPQLWNSLPPDLRNIT